MYVTMLIRLIAVKSVLTNLLTRDETGGVTVPVVRSNDPTSSNNYCIKSGRSSTVSVETACSCLSAGKSERGPNLVRDTNS